MGNNNAAMTANEAHEQRTKLLFLGFLSSVLGVDQTYSGDDGTPASQPGQYTIANPDGTYSVQGQAVSNLNQPLAAAGVSPGMLMLFAAGLVFLLAK